jgi:hypothetical protein
MAEHEGEMGEEGLLRWWAATMLVVVDRKVKGREESGEQ